MFPLITRAITLLLDAILGARELGDYRSTTSPRRPL